MDNIKHLIEGEKELSPEYLAGAADGLLRTQVRTYQRTEGNPYLFVEVDFKPVPVNLELSIVAESKNPTIMNFWRKYFNQPIPDEPSKRMVIYTAQECLAIMKKHELFNHLLLREWEFTVFKEIAFWRGKVDTWGKYGNVLGKLQFYFNMYNTGKFVLDMSRPISPQYLAGLFELSPKGAIWIEKSSESLVVQLSSPFPELAEYLVGNYGGGISKAFTRGKSKYDKPSSYTWKVKGKKADFFYAEILKPNFQFDQIEIEES